MENKRQETWKCVELLAGGRFWSPLNSGYLPAGFTVFAGHNANLYDKGTELEITAVVKSKDSEEPEPTESSDDLENWFSDEEYRDLVDKFGDFNPNWPGWNNIEAALKKKYGKPPDYITKSDQLKSDIRYIKQIENLNKEHVETLLLTNRKIVGARDMLLKIADTNREMLIAAFSDLLIINAETVGKATDEEHAKEDS